MKHGFEYDPRSLRLSAAQVQQVAEDVKKLAGSGEWSDVTVFGSDPFGAVVGVLHTRWVGPLLDQLRVIPGLLGDHAGRYRVMADDTEAADADVADQMGRIGQRGV